MSWFVYVVRVGTEGPRLQRQSEIRNHVMEVLPKNEVGCRPYFTPIHLQPFYRDTFGFREGDFPVTEKAGRISIAIPFHNNLTSLEVEYVVGGVGGGNQDGVGWEVLTGRHPPDRRQAWTGRHRGLLRVPWFRVQGQQCANARTHLLTTDPLGILQPAT